MAINNAGNSAKNKAYLIGDDSIILNGRILSDFHAGTIASLDFPTSLCSIKKGKNGNTVYSFSKKGEQAELSLNIIRGSSDDLALNSLLLAQKLNPRFVVLLTGRIIRRVGTPGGRGAFIEELSTEQIATSQDNYILSGGVFAGIPPISVNVDGEVEQNIAQYKILFATGERTIT